MRADADARERTELFAISPGRGDLARLEASAPRLFDRGVRRFLLREKELPASERRRFAARLAPICRKHEIELWIAEDAELARSVGADGVQLSERSPSPLDVRARHPALPIGVSLHDPISRTPQEIAICAHAFLGPVFATPSKPGARPLGVERFVALARELPLPVFAVGGIGAAELDLLARAGVTRVAAIRLFFGD